LVVPSRRLLAGLNTSIGGLALNTLKKLKGARFGFPSLSTVLAKQIGLGPIAPKRNWCNCGTGTSEGITVICDMQKRN
jgi:hypothetical protein